MKDIIAIAARWRDANPEHVAGVVLVWQGEVYGWKNCLRDASHERPGALAIDVQGHIFEAQGGNDYDGTKCWVAQH
ncbi:antirestriction protein ArdR [Serratia symbiotica]|uniref:antirestriction protein ArdR n=1 Tax=Serratia symbiotica TaxID=138074 RepID=UPI001CF012FF|nr:antirestriction protein ArdR [Serratia symbiotica]